MSLETRQKRGAARRPFSLGLAALLACSFAEAAPTPSPVAEGTLRIASWNVSFFRRNEGDLARELANSESQQPRNIAAVLQKIRPDVLLINEFDYDRNSPALFQKNYL